MSRERKPIARNQGSALASAEPARKLPAGARRRSPDLDRLRANLEIVATLVLEDPVYGPIFDRLEQEIAIEEAALSQDVVERARAVLRQNAIGESKSLNISSDAPLP